MGRLSKTTMLIAAAALVLAGCGSDNNDPSSEGSESPGAGEGVCDGSTGDGPKVGLAYDVGGRGDLSFNDSAYEGVRKAVEEVGATCKEAEAGAGENDADREERLRLLADAGFNPILAIGFVYSPAVGKVAAEYPEVDFAVVDGYVTFLTGRHGPRGERHRPQLRRQRGLFPRRRRGRAEDQDRDGRLPRWRQRSR